LWKKTIRIILYGIIRYAETLSLVEVFLHSRFLWCDITDSHERHTLLFTCRLYSLVLCCAGQEQVKSTSGSG